MGMKMSSQFNNGSPLTNQLEKSNRFYIAEAHSPLNSFNTRSRRNAL